MALTVNTNAASLNAQRQLTNSTSLLGKSLERLSSGLRINRASDDAAGLAISEGLRSQVRGLNQAIRNANDGISVVGTAEGALQESTAIIQRIRELAVQASSDTNSASNRSALQAEIDQNIQELTRIGNTVQFNGLSLLDGSFAGKNIQVGANQNQTISLSISDTRSSSLGKIAQLTTGRIANNLTAGELSVNGAAVGASSADGVSYARSNASAIAVAAAVNASSATSNVTAEVNATEISNVAANTTTGAVNGIASLGAISINGEDIAASVAGDDTVSAFQNANSAIAVAAAINDSTAQTGVTATANNTEVAFDDNGTVQNVDLTQGDNHLVINGKRVAVDLSSYDDGEEAAQALAAAINNTSGLGTGNGGFITASTDAAGHLELTATDGRNIDVATTGGASTTNTGQVNGLASGQLTLNGTSVGASLAGSDLVSTVQNANSAIAEAAAINLGSTTHGVSATAGPTTVTFAAPAAGDFTTGTGDYTLSINGSANINVNLNAGTAAGRAGQLKTAIDALSISGVTTAVSGNNLVLTAADGRNVDLVTTGTDSGVTGGEALGFGVGEQFAGNSFSDGTFSGTVTLSSSLSFTIGGTSTEFTNGAVAATAASGDNIGAALGLSSTNDLARTAYKGTVTMGSDTEFTVAGASTGFTADTFGSGIGAVVLNGSTNSLTINGVNIGSVTVLANDASGSLLQAINGLSNKTGVTASLGGDNQLVLTAEDGRNVTVTSTGEVGQKLGFKGVGNVTDNTTSGTVTLFSKNAFSVAGSNPADAGLTAQSVAVDPDSGVVSIDVTTAEGAANGIRTADLALEQLSKVRSDLGATSNRLEATIRNLQTVSENLAASDSRIRDADFASETASLVRAQILQQAGLAILAQANVAPQAALSLLG